MKHKSVKNGILQSSFLFTKRLCSKEIISKFKWYVYGFVFTYTFMYLLKKKLANPSKFMVSWAKWALIIRYWREASNSVLIWFLMAVVHWGLSFLPSEALALPIGSIWIPLASPMLQDAQVDWIKNEANISFKIILKNLDCILYR